MIWQSLLGEGARASAMTAAIELAQAIAASSERARASERTLFWAYLINHVDEPFARDAYFAAINDLMAELRVRRLGRSTAGWPGSAGRWRTCSGTRSRTCSR